MPASAKLSASKAKPLTAIDASRAIDVHCLCTVLCCGSKCKRLSQNGCGCSVLCCFSNQRTLTFGQLAPVPRLLLLSCCDCTILAEFSATLAHGHQPWHQAVFPQPRRRRSPPHYSWRPSPRCVHHVGAHALQAQSLDREKTRQWVPRPLDVRFLSLQRTAPRLTGIRAVPSPSPFGYASQSQQCAASTSGWGNPALA